MGESTDIDDAWDELIGAAVPDAVPPPPEFAGATDEEMQARPSAKLPLDVVPMSGGDTDVLPIIATDPPEVAAPVVAPSVSRRPTAPEDGVAAPQVEVSADPVMAVAVRPSTGKNVVVPPRVALRQSYPAVKVEPRGRRGRGGKAASTRVPPGAKVSPRAPASDEAGPGLLAGGPMSASQRSTDAVAAPQAVVPAPSSGRNVARTERHEVARARKLGRKALKGATQRASPLRGLTQQAPSVRAEDEEIELDVDDILLTGPNATVPMAAELPEPAVEQSDASPMAGEIDVAPTAASADSATAGEIETPTEGESDVTQLDVSVEASGSIPALPRREESLAIAPPRRVPPVAWAGAALVVVLGVGWATLGGDDRAAEDTVATTPRTADAEPLAPAPAGVVAPRPDARGGADAAPEILAARTAAPDADPPSAVPDAAEPDAAAEPGDAARGAVAGDDAEPGAKPDAAAEAEPGGAAPSEQEASSDESSPARPAAAVASPTAAARREAGKRYVAAYRRHEAEPSNEGLEAMAMAACEMDDGMRARSAFRKMKGGEGRRRVARRCAAVDVNLWAPGKEATPTELIRAARRYLEEGDPARALEAARASNNGTRSGEALLVMGDAYCRLGKPDKASALLRHLPVPLRPELKALCADAGVDEL